jgi:hypothetical protein
VAAYNKFNAFVEHMAEKSHNLGSDAITCALTATANAPVATNSILTDLTQISYTNLSSRVFTVTTSAQSSGTFTWLLADLTLTASGGSVAAFQYVVIYNDTMTVPSADGLIAWYDYGSALTLANTETLLIDFTTSTFTLV